MKIIKDQIPTLKRGRLVTVELGLGGQVDEVVAGHVLTLSHRVVWCSVSQEWVE